MLAEDPTDLWKRDAMRHPSVQPPENPHARLWRYLSGEKFHWLVEQRRLYMPRLEQLAHNDPREGTMPDGHAAWWRESIKSAATPDEAKAILDNFQRIKGFVDRFRRDWFVSCWTKSETENFAFWQIYGRNEATCGDCGQRRVGPTQSVAITTTFSKLERNLPAYVEVGVVKYSDYQITGAGIANMLDYVMSKRQFYEYESEVRAIAHPYLTGGATSPAVSEHFAGSMIGSAYAPSVNVNGLIDEVILHPESTEQFANEIRSLCAEHALPQPRLSGLAA
ncbi:hypothetical protein [Bradyrhizobium diazoefficiens]